MNRIEGQGLVYFKFPHFEQLEWLVHGFSSRIGGVSQSPYWSLNMGLHVGDDQAAVVQNRAAFMDTLGLQPELLVTGEQIHGTKVAHVASGDRGRGALNLETSISGVDSLITNLPDIPLGSFYADCVPVYIVDPVKRAIGIAHAGWKGALGRIAAEAVGAMGRSFDTKAQDVLVGVGPHIGVCCYYVDSSLADRFQNEFPEIKGLVEDGGRGYRLNLSLAVQAQLIEAGCKRDNIYFARQCTACDTGTFFSHRAEAGRTGRMLAVLSIKHI